MKQTFWGVVSAAAGRLGTWGVHLSHPFPLARSIWLTICKATFLRTDEKEKDSKFTVCVHGSKKVSWVVKNVKHSRQYLLHTYSVEKSAVFDTNVIGFRSGEIFQAQVAVT